MALREGRIYCSVPMTLTGDSSADDSGDELEWPLAETGDVDSRFSTSGLLEAKGNGFTDNFGFFFRRTELSFSSSVRKFRLILCRAPGVLSGPRRLGTVSYVHSLLPERLLQL
jgi:hypothetical protein